MTNIEAMKQALDALERHATQRTYAGGVVICNAAIALRQAISEAECCCGEPEAHGVVHRVGAPCYVAEQAEQEPVAWNSITTDYPKGEPLDILMGDGSMLCDVLPQSDGDLWWDGAGTGEKFIDPNYATITHWRLHSKYTAPSKAELDAEYCRGRNDGYEAGMQFAKQQAEQRSDSEQLEPVAWWDDEYGMCVCDGEGRKPLYTAPPQREWVSLTDDEIVYILKIGEFSSLMKQSCVNDYRAIEAKLKEKNS